MPFVCRTEARKIEPNGVTTGDIPMLIRLASGSDSLPNTVGIGSFVTKQRTVGNLS